MANVQSERNILRSGPKDPVEFYNNFLRQNDTQGVIIPSPSPSQGNSMVVVDMQNDFVLNAPHGRFSVAGGEKASADLKGFLNANIDNFTKIIFTRDTHDVKHCSFSIFPPHCVINHEGAAFHKNMKEFYDELDEEKKKKIGVIFKGCSSVNVDSFGAEEYTDDEYRTKRQLGTCCPFGNCLEETGGKYLKDKSKTGFEDYPFKIDTCLESEVTKCNKSKTNTIYDELGEKFKIADLLNGQVIGTHNIYVVGLAGDYCVKDTAINLMNKIKRIKGMTINVYVLQPFVRYAFLPLQFIAPGQVYKGEKMVNIKTNFTRKPNAGQEKKDIHHYLFQIKDDGYNLLTAVNAVKADLSTIESGVNPNVYASFLTPTRDIIKDYANVGVKMILKVPDITPISYNSVSLLNIYDNRIPELEEELRNKQKNLKNAQGTLFLDVTNPISIKAVKKANKDVKNANKAVLEASTALEGGSHHTRKNKRKAKSTRKSKSHIRVKRQ
jgi:nicotinamidase-related amidase